MKILAATNNQNKVKEIRQIFEGVEIVSLAEAGIDIDVEETGETFRDNALIKARTVYDMANCPVLSDDSGLSVAALGGRPGVLSARFAGEHGNTEANNRKLLAELEGVSDRRAEFVCAVAFVCPQGEFVAEGRVSGRILNAPEGEGGFGYDPLFYCDELKKSFAVASSEQKNSVSHRGRALRALADKLRESKII